MPFPVLVPTGSGSIRPRHLRVQRCGGGSRGFRAARRGVQWGRQAAERLLDRLSGRARWLWITSSRVAAITSADLQAGTAIGLRSAAVCDGWTAWGGAANGRRRLRFRSRWRVPADAVLLAAMRRQARFGTRKRSAIWSVGNGNSRPVVAESLYPPLSVRCSLSAMPNLNERMAKTVDGRYRPRNCDTDRWQSMWPGLSLPYRSRQRDALANHAGMSEIGFNELLPLLVALHALFTNRIR